jgi:hypothetical protein
MPVESITHEGDKQGARLDGARIGEDTRKPLLSGSSDGRPRGRLDGKSERFVNA